MSGIHMGLLASKPPGPAFLSYDSGNVVGGNTVVVPKPAGVVSGMLLVALMFTLTAAGARTWTGDAGWAEQVDQGVLPNLRVATLVTGGAEPANYTFTVSGAATSAGAFIMAFERASFDAIGAIGTSTGVTNCIAPSVNATLPGLLLAIFAKDAVGVWSTPAGMTSIFSANTVNVFSQFTNIGATGTRTSTPTGIDDNAGVLVSLI